MIETAERDVDFYSDFDRQPVKLKQHRNDMIKTGTAAARVALPIPFSVCSISVCPNNKYQCLGLLTWAHMLMHAIAHRG